MMQSLARLRRILLIIQTRDLILGSGGCRKLRWALQSYGKRDGARLIYVNYLAVGEIVLLAIYAKTQVGNIPAHLLKKLKEQLDET